MPKRSKEDTEITIQKIMDAVVDQLLRLGYDRMSYTTLSQQTGVSRTGISHHFPKKTDFTAALDARIFKMFVEHLRFDKGLTTFSDSWMTALENAEFVAILKLLFHHIVATENAHEFATNGIDRLYKMVGSQFGDGSDKELEWLIGRSLIQMSK
ncbi:TetR family transcriptional regulator [Vibrio natriegens]|uniref:Transcriptional regulator n=1 Tax=Vibrio natriegens NBRC 15636 = ATCC 14048 = DSM 759 TaxID=1219067 RepID=A0AAN0Y6K3_VIBNA|nr:TetR family transcriptional regulator [Vibrio natriegens]ALR18772.1 transcriptional regulator [Vibrio natriegens NBRC 15636 = ATCC 14048 = DSM 759]ANQ14739.1 transcriptional regulator [Vibrio natriegens NBRC 15636 = ATCC 14048 = DSM 759]EPM39783.1 transcriptional regulator [Vibrio natriegens NBRC 15636 = ATCC 14048 = DSM 759]MDX6028294.1 TetR family transcriptional regulator [Vibrio natriegens NBRC 15636 = ATCC 14048 = DSM 759]UUI13375.1 TetR family transcriptional regulator [Vibrio natrieg